MGDLRDIDGYNSTVDKRKNFTMEDGIYKGKVVNNLSKYKSVGEMLWKSIKKYKDNIAHLDACTEATATYGEVQDKAVRCALWLQKQGIKFDDVITVCTNNHLNSIIPCVSASYINAIINPWNENMDLKTAVHVLQLTTPKVIFCSEKCVDIILNAMKEKNYNAKIVVFGNHASVVSFSDILKNYSNEEVENFHYVELDDANKTAIIMHSSGTTGMPKGVELSNYSLIILSQEENLRMENASSLWFSSLYWLSGVMMNFNAFATGTKVILYSEFDEEMTCRLIEKFKITTMFLSTSMLHRFLKAGFAKNYCLLSWRTLMTGGALIKPNVQEEMRRILPHVNMLQGYGLTEICGIATVQLPHHKNGSCGTVAKNVQLKIVDPESGKILGPNQSGEIWLKSVIMMKGYYKNPEATKSTLDEEGWLHTGDIGYMDEDGELFIVDRIKELIKYRGYQISPGEIEHVLMLHPAVLEAVVIGVLHPLDDEHPLAYVTKKPNSEVSEQELIDYVAKNMMDQYKLRAGVIFLDKFPYTGSGKISRKDLKELTKSLKQ